jgi:Transglycosylase SLT domain
VRLFTALPSLILCSTCFAADLAVLRNGNAIRHERKEIRGAVTRLYTAVTNDGYIEIPSDQIDHFERDISPVPASVGSRAQAGTSLNPWSQEALTKEGLNQALNSAGERHQIDPDFIRSVIKAESGFHPDAVSRKGALGLMQLMPGTALELGVTNPFDPNSNVEGGTKYLRDLLEKYNFDVNKALAAYNAGPKRVDRYHGVPPYYETQAYISRIIRDFNRRKIAKNPALARKTTAPANKQAVPKKPAASAASTGPSRSPQTRSSSGTPSIPKGPETASR